MLFSVVGTLKFAAGKTVNVLVNPTSDGDGVNLYTQPLVDRLPEFVAQLRTWKSTEFAQSFHAFAMSVTFLVSCRFVRLISTAPRHACLGRLDTVSKFLRTQSWEGLGVPTNQTFLRRVRGLV